MGSTGRAVDMVAAFIFLYMRVTFGTVLETQLFLCFEELCHATRSIALILCACLSRVRDMAARASYFQAFSASKDGRDACFWLGDAVNLAAFGCWTVAELVLVSAHKRRKRGL